MASHTAIRTSVGVSPVEAVELINRLVYRPGWKISARTFQERYESAIVVTIEFTAQNTSEPPLYPHAFELHNEFVILTGECPTILHVLRKLLGEILRLEEHEAREFLRLPEDAGYVAPFHPHTDFGMDMWARLGTRHTGLSVKEQMITRDLQFGRA